MKTNWLNKSVKRVKFKYGRMTAFITQCSVILHCLKSRGVKFKSHHTHKFECCCFNQYLNLKKQWKFKVKSIKINKFKEKEKRKEKNDEMSVINCMSKEILLVVKKTHLKQFYSDYAEEQSGTCKAPVNNTKDFQKKDRSKFSFRKEIEANVNCFYQKKPAANVTCLHQKKPEANVNCLHQKKPEANVDCFHQYLLE